MKIPQPTYFTKLLKRVVLLGLLMLVILFNVVAGPDNIAPKAKVETSTDLNNDFRGENVVDGVIGIHNNGEWASEGDTTDWGYVRFPWIKLTWDEPQTINRVVLYDRPIAKDHIAGGRLQFSDGSEVWVNQIPNDGTAKAVHFDSKEVTWIKFVTTDGKGKDLGFSEIEVYAAPSPNVDYVSLVDPYIETNRGRYFFFVPGGRPFGMVGAAPHTRNKNQNGGGYNYNETEILGFGQIHNWMMAGLEIMPTSKNVNPTLGENGWKSTFSHDDEIVQPGYQRVFLRDYKTWVELTSTDRVSFYKFTYTEDMEAQIIANLGGYLGNSTMTNATVNKVNENELEGSFSTIDRYWGGPKDVKVFFVIQFDKPFDSLNGWEGDSISENITSSEGNNAGISALYGVEGGDEIQMKIGISYTSVENARNNLISECNSWDFEAVREDSRAIWNDWLGKIAVTGGSMDQQVKFYTDLWHVLLGRHKINDLNGDYPDRTEGERDGNFTDAVFKVKTLPKNEDGGLAYNMYNSDAWWLSQWNLNVLWGLAWPEMQDEMSASMIQYAKNGYLLPRGPAGGGYSYIMTSNPVTNLIASTFMKGLLTKVDEKEAYQIVKQNHLPGGMLGDKDDIEFYTANGYWPGNAGVTIEAAFQDFAVSQMAEKLGYEEDHQYFKNRSEGWKKLFRPEQNLLFPKDKNGNFLHSNPLSGEGWVEANAWQATWGVSHDISGLISLAGSADTVTSKLNFAFEQAQPSDFVFAYNDGYVSYANQPGCSNAHVFSHAGKPWLTQYWVRKVNEQAYGGVTPDLGYGGHDEDQGQMGGVSALMSIGLFNILGNVNSNPFYEITSPVFDEISIELDQKYYLGERFVIKTFDNSSENIYIQKARLNGEELQNFWFTHEDFANGGELEIWLGPEPNKNWGVSNLPLDIKL
ncbi:GH92 family glycosyl hydrolase [Litoribacter populi]|uniref:GH92 family glycosyl hydrolase n=1 Tax=Litoribacter populi TaxID=2598460 RepID=UPI00117F9C15|nr:GH92 family glycosyl hydrolase [Litoribacter populi]